MCQDTGTAIVDGEEVRGRATSGRRRRGDRARHLRRLHADQPALLQLAPVDDVRGEEHRTNLPAQIELTPSHGVTEYKFLFMAKGGGSANKSFLYQETKASLEPAAAAGGSSTRRCARSAPRPARRTTSRSSSAARRPSSRSRPQSTPQRTTSTTCPTSDRPRRLPRPELEQQVFELTQSASGSARSSAAVLLPRRARGALPRHGRPARSRSPCPARRTGGRSARSPRRAFSSSSSETDPGALRRPKPGWPGHQRRRGGRRRPQPADVEILAQLSRIPVKTRLSLTGPLVVARDIAHAKIKERRRRRAGPAVPRDHRLLRGSGQDARRHGVGLVRPDHRRPDGLVRRAAPVRGRRPRW